MKTVLLAVLLVASACAGLPAATPTPSPTVRLALDVPIASGSLKTYAIAPVDTDSSITLKLEPHFVAFDPSAPRRGELFVFLTGMAPTPAQGTLIVRQAAANGFHAISLSYQKVNDRALCETNADDTCYEKLRLAMIDGGDRAPLFTIARQHSINSLLGKLLTHLATRFPADNWSTYVQDGAPKWSAIRLGGLSGGGSFAAMIGREKELARLCLFEAPIDLIGAPGADRRVPPWVMQPRATPADRTYGFRNAKTDNPNAVAFPLAWAAFGIDRLGAPADTDSLKSPYERSHHLTSSASPATNDGAANLVHRSIVIDAVTPKTAGGEPLFAPVWQYMCFS